jgi:hypothetical protein
MPIYLLKAARVTCIDLLRRDDMGLGTIVGATLLFYIFVAACLYLQPEVPELPVCEKEGSKSSES